MDNYDYYISGIEELLRDNTQGLTVSEIAPALHMSRNTVGKYLEIMYLSGIVDVRMMGKAKLYYLSPRVPVTRLLSYLTDTVIQTDDQYRIVHLNLTALDLLGADEEDLIGRNLLDLLGILGMTGEIRSRITRSDRDVAFAAEIELRQEGTPRHLLMTVADMVMYDGISGHTFILEDITDLKTAEEGKRLYEFLFTTLAEETWERVCLFSPDGTLLYGNRQYLSSDGRGYDVIQRSSIMDPYDSRSAQVIRDTISTVTSTQDLTRVVFQASQPGLPHWLDLRLFPVPETSGPVRTIFGISREVTGFQEGGNASALLTVLLNTMTEGVLTVTAGGTILSWNRGAEQITGYPAEELLGGTAQTIIPPELNGGQDVITDAVRGERVTDLRMTIRAKGGRKKKVILSSAAVPDHTGIISQVMLVWREP